MTSPSQLARECLAEFIGTLILVFFGVGAVNAAVLAGVTQGLWQVAAIWAIGVALAIYATGAVSGAHINPAITVALAVWRGFPKVKIGPYVVAQVAGAFCGSLMLYGLFHGLLTHFEVAHHLVRGGPGSELSAMVFGEYFPNPAMIGTSSDAYTQVPMITAFLAEAIGAAFLACFVFTLTSARNPVGPRFAVPVFIGLALAVIIMIIAPLTQAGLNPARDFGPRVLAYLLGWGKVAIPGPRGGFFVVYIVAPVLGAVAGAGVYEWLGRSLRLAPAQGKETEGAGALARSDEVEVGVYDSNTVMEKVVMKPSRADCHSRPLRRLRARRMRYRPTRRRSARGIHSRCRHRRGERMPAGHEKLRRRDRRIERLPGLRSPAGVRLPSRGGRLRSLGSGSSRAAAAGSGPARPPGGTRPSARGGHTRFASNGLRRDARSAALPRGDGPHHRSLRRHLGQADGPPLPQRLGRQR